MKKIRKMICIAAITLMACNNGHECFEDCKICWNSQIVGDYITTKKKNNNETLMAV